MNIFFNVFFIKGIHSLIKSHTTSTNIIKIGQTLKNIAAESFLLGGATKQFEDILNICTCFHPIGFH